MIARTGTLLGELPDGSSLSAFLPKIDVAAPNRELRCRIAVASTLLAGLELARQGDVVLGQPEPWRDIAVFSVRASDEPEDSQARAAMPSLEQGGEQAATMFAVGVGPASASSMSFQMGRPDGAAKIESVHDLH